MEDNSSAKRNKFFRASAEAGGGGGGKTEANPITTTDRVHDPTYLRRHPLSFTYYPPETNGRGVCDDPFGRGEEGYRGIWALHKIRVVQNDPENEKQVLCIVYTHSKRHHVVQAIAETYGHRCHGFMAASNETNRTIGAINIPHEGREEYKNMWQKVRSIWTYVYSNYLNDFDYFFIAGDNTYVIAENLIHTCTSIQVSPNKPVYLGHAHCGSGRLRIFCSGGAGYVLNRAALRRLVEKEFPKSRCHPTDRRPDEDQLVGVCLRKSVVNCTHSVDEFNETRFHGMDAHYHATYFKRQSSPWSARGLQKVHNITAPSKEYLESVSSTTVSFHLVRYKVSEYGRSPQSTFADQGLRRYHAIIYNLCYPDQDKYKMNPENGCKIDREQPIKSDKACRKKLKDESVSFV